MNFRNISTMRAVDVTNTENCSYSEILEFENEIRDRLASWRDECVSGSIRRVNVRQAKPFLLELKEKLNNPLL